jgi:hypothetical protein
MTSSLGLKFKLKFEILQNFGLHSFELARFYCISQIQVRHVTSELISTVPNKGSQANLSTVCAAHHAGIG